MTNHKITPEIVDALNTVRVHARYHSTPHSLRDAINALDNAGVFREVDEVAAELEDQRLLRKYDAN